MAIKIVGQANPVQESDAPEKITLDIDNGDLEVLNNLQEEWNFVDTPSVLRFALAVLKKAVNKKVYIDQEGKPIAVTPGDKLLKSQPSPSQAI